VAPYANKSSRTQENSHADHTKGGRTLKIQPAPVEERPHTYIHTKQRLRLHQERLMLHQRSCGYINRRLRPHQRRLRLPQERLMLYQRSCSYINRSCGFIKGAAATSTGGYVHIKGGCGYLTGNHHEITATGHPQSIQGGHG
jgi:hypothetical protein